ncbi:MAG TPA: 3-oxoacyl-[acyl-carrier-protein] synthase III C-terminal domain-containing protein [Parafilimonas sp.]
MSSGLTLKNLMNIQVSGSGTAFPERGRWVTNDDIHQMIFGDDWRQKMTSKNLRPDYYETELGLKKRFWTHTPGSIITHNELTSADLMIEAAENAIKDSGINKDEIDFVIAVTITSPKYSTSMGAFVAGKLGIHAPAFEMKSGCASNIFSITLAAQLLQNGARNVLITCGETTTKILKLNSTMAYAGGDAGAAIVLSGTDADNKGIVAAYLNTNGLYSSYMGVNGLMPPNQQDIDNENYYLTFAEGTEDFLHQAWSSTPEILYKASGINAEEIDCLIPHQVHKKRTIAAAKAACIPMNKTIDIIGETANCGSPTILVALDYARKNSRLTKNKTALLIAAGGGISWGGIILKT